MIDSIPWPDVHRRWGKTEIKPTESELSVDGAPIVDQCLRRGLLINATHGTVLRLLPALTLTDEQLDNGCGILEEVLLAHKA